MITLRFVEITPEMQRDAILLQLQDPAALAVLKDRMLARLGIKRAPEQKHLDAWTLAMARENELPAVLPQTAIGDAVLESGAHHFVFWLA